MNQTLAEIVAEGDPWGAVYEPGEIATTVIVAIVFLVSGAGVLYATLNWRYPPIKVKQMELVATTYIAGCFWMMGSMASSRLLPQLNNPVLLVCDLWGIWLQIVAGIFLLLSCILFRFWRLYWILKFNRKATTKLFYSSFFVFWGPIIVYGIVTSAFKVNGPIDQPGVGVHCLFNQSADYAILAFLGVYLILFIFFGISLMGIKQKYLNEYKETRNSIVVFVVAYIISLILSALNEQYQLWGRIVSNFIVLIIVTFTIWQIIGVPMYHCIWNREEYEKQFKEQVKAFSKTLSNGGEIPSSEMIEKSEKSEKTEP